jgi:hypothetical protein
VTGSIPDPSASPSAPTPTPDDDAPVADAPVVRARVRRAPRFGRFVGAGAGLGLVVALVLSSVGTAADPGDRMQLFAFLALLLLLVGGIVGGIVAIFADRRSR